MKPAKITLDDFQEFDARFKKGMEVARAIDKHRAIPHAVTIEAHNIIDFVKALTPKRVELFRLTQRKRRLSISELAVAAHRDASSVSKDISTLQRLGLVSVEIEPNAGHGVKKVVQPVADKIEVRALVI